MQIHALPQRTEHAPFKTYKPTIADEKYVHDALAFLGMTFAFAATVFYSEMQVKYTKDVPWAATDAHTIWINVEGCKKEGWGIEEMAFVIAHEAMHYVFGDLIMSAAWNRLKDLLLPDGSTIPYNHMLMNYAMDFRINAALIEGKVGKMPKIGCFDPTISAKGMEGCVEIYVKLYKAGKPQDGGFDQHVEPGTQEQEKEKRIGQVRREQVIAAAVQAHEASGQGNLPGVLKRLIGEILDPHVPWNEHLRATIMRAAGEPSRDWSKVDKRLISRPDHKIVFGRKSYAGCGDVVVGYDTSGSCNNDQMMTRFFSEMAGIVADLNPERLIVIFCDTEVNRVDEVEEPSDMEAYRAKVNDEGGVPGGGGTSFVPVFDKIAELGIEPDMLVYLTDTYGDFPNHEPSFPVIWGSIVKNPRVPFGTVVEVEL